MTRQRMAWVGLGLLGLLAPASAQDATTRDEPATVEQVFVPEQAFDRVLQRHPEGVVVSQDELRELLRRAGRRPADAPELEAEAPIPTTIESVSATGSVSEQVAELRVEARVTVLTARTVLLELPVRGLGLTTLTVDGEDAGLVKTRSGAAVILAGAARDADGRIVPATRTLVYTFATRTRLGDERGSGLVSFPIPAAASGRFALSVPGDLDATCQGGLVWIEGRSAGATTIAGAFGGTAAGRSDVTVTWRPRRAVLDVTPYVVADARSVFLVRQGVVTLESTARVGVYRAHRDTFAFDLPPGFVVRELETQQGELTYAQKGDRVEVRLSSPREGLLEFRLRAELPTGSEGETEELVLEPLQMPGVDRVSGLLGVAQGEGSVVTFTKVEGLDQADVSRLGAGADGLVRVYGHTGEAGRIELTVAPLEPQVDLELKAAFQLEEREVSALAAYRFVVREGKVFAVRVQLPAHYELDQVVIRDEQRREPRYEQRQLLGADGRPELLIELPNGMKAGQELLVTVQARRTLERPLGAQRLAVPLLSGAPASRVSGYLGFAPDQAYRLKSADLTALTAIPAEELPRAGLDVHGLVLGYRVEEAAYAGQVVVERRSTRVSTRTLIEHRVVERIVRSEAQLELEIEGAPVEAIELWLPAGVERLTRISGGTARWEDRERMAEADGRVRWKLPFEARQSGVIYLQVQFETKLPTGDGAGATLEALPRVSLADAFRERGAIAIFSGGMTELEPAPRNVQPLEVTEVPGQDEDDERPLFAYTFVGDDHGVGLTITRHPASEILSALAERLDLVTTADAEGASRHTATFTVKNLDNQFFALRLPTGAKLWSVVVDGVGVKPAERNGLMIVPIASAGAKGPDEATTVSATYTLRGDAWGGVGELSLIAPELLLDVDHSVPVLATRWELALPEDYRVLEYDGNVTTERGAVSAAPLFTQRAWRFLKRADLEWLLIPLLLGLIAAASVRVRQALLAGLDRSLSAVGAARRTAGSVPRPSPKRVVVLVGGLALLFGFVSLTTVTMKGGMDRALEGATATMMPQAAAPRAPMEAGGAVGGDWGGDGGEAMPAADYEYELQQAPGGRANHVAEEKAKAEAYFEGAELMDAEEFDGGSADEDDLALSYDEVDAESAVPSPAPAPPARRRPAARPLPAQPMEPEPSTPMAEPQSAPRSEALNRADMGPGAQSGRGGRQDKKGEQQAAGLPATGRVDDAIGGGMTQLNADSLGEIEKAIDAPATSEDSALTLEQLGLAKDANVETRVSAIEIPGALGQVGLRSLVLSLDAVGQRASFSRPGGQALLSFSFVKESLLSGVGGLLALLGFALAFLAPRSGKVSYPTLLLLALALLTALPLVGAPQALIPACNALAFGLAIALPVHVAVAVFGWLGTRPLHRLRQALAERRRARSQSPAAPRAGAVAGLLLLLVGLFGAPAPASAQEPRVERQGPRVYVPYDPTDPERIPDRVYVPGEVYAELWKRAFPDTVAPEVAKPLADAVIERADYTGALADGALTLTVAVQVEVLADGWHEIPLGLAGVGLNGSTVRGGDPKARVTVAPAGGFQLVAKGPARYAVELDLKAPKLGEHYAFATVPTLTAGMTLTSDLTDRRVVVGGAKAQTERALDDGRLRVEASLGDADRVQLSFPGKAVLSSGGASEASATTRSIAWARRGRVLLVSKTTFAISGAGREGFVFDVPPGLEVLAVQTPNLLDWQMGEGRLEIRLRRASGGQQEVQVWAERLVPHDATAFDVPHLHAQGVSRESGSFGLAADDGIRLRAQPEGGVTRDTGGDLRGLASALSRAAQTEVRVDSAFRFSRRPSPLRVEIVDEPAEVKASVSTAATFLADRTEVRAEVAYEVRRGTVYQLELAVPADLELVGRAQGLDVRETSISEPRDGARIYHLGLASGLTGSGQITLAFQRRHVLTDSLELGFPDVRPLHVAQETSTIGLAVAPGLRLHVPRDPAGLSGANPRSLGRRVGTPAGGADWTLAYRRANERSVGLAEGVVTLRRPAAEVTGSWVLHAYVERDVVRYALRALYTIENAGARTFQVYLPASVERRFTVEAANLREYRTVSEGDAQRVTVELQSPAEGFYDLALTWEETLRDGADGFAIPSVGIEGVDQWGRGYVLVEKAPEVSDLLREGRIEGAVERGRAADAPALPPGRDANDFAFVYRVMLKGRLGWSVQNALQPTGALTMPAPARIPHAHLTTVVSGEGRARHRAIYRVRNQRLQFLSLDLPAVNGVTAEVWSVHVGGHPRRPHQQANRLLIPLPKRTEADLSFDVEVIYATPLPGSLGFGGELSAQAPTLASQGVTVERTFWTLYLPESYDYGDFGGTMSAASQADLQVQALAGQVRELKELEELVRTSTGNTRAVANDNVLLQLDRIEDQLEVCDEAVGQAGGEAQQELGKNRSDVQRLRSLIEARVREQEVDERAQAQRLAQQEQVLVEGQNFKQMASGWYSNDAVNTQNRVEWSGVADEGRARQRDTAWTLTVPEGLDLDLMNAEVFKTGEVRARPGDEANYAQARGLLGNSNYGNAYRQGQKAQAHREEQTRLQQEIGGLAGRNVIVEPDATEADFEPASSAGRLSMRVRFETPGRAYHFRSEPDEAQVEVSVSSYPRRTTERGVTVAQGLMLALLLLGVIRLGLLTPPAAGARARHLLLVGAAAALAVGVFVHLALAGLAGLVGVAAMRHGKLA